MRTPPARIRLATILLLAAVVALACAAVRTWRDGLSHAPGPSERLARSLLDARSARPDRPPPSTRDDLFPAALAAAFLARGLASRRIP